MTILKYLLVPSSMVIVLFIGGALFYALSARKIARYLLAAAVIVYVIFSIGPVSFWLLGKLEYQYPYLQDTSQLNGVRYIVILSGYADDDANIALSSRVNSSSAFRLMEALKLHRELPATRIIITGSTRISRVMKEVLVSLGAKEDRIILEEQSASTFENATNIGKFVGRHRFVLVTSAGHMPRSMMVFKKAGMDPIPAPTDYYTFKNYMAISYLPSPLHLINSDLAMHEYLGILWYRVKGWI